MSLRFSIFTVVWGCVLALVTVVIAAHPIVEIDPFWHLNLARAVLEHGSRLVPEPSAVSAFSDPAFVPEWLWAVVTYGLYQWAGPEAMTGLVLLIGAAIPFALIAMLRSSQPDAGRAALVLVSGLLVCIVLSRLRLRPQAAFMLLLPLFMWICSRYTAADRRRGWTVLLLGVGLLWVQLHGSFVLAPPVFAILAAPVLLQSGPWRTHILARTRGASGGQGTAAERWPSREGWRYVAVLAGLSALALTGAYGVQIADYISAHGGGDSKRHIQDIAPPTWEIFKPGASPFATAYVALWALALLGAVRRQKVRWQLWALALLGLALGLNARRFFAAGGILLAPLALDGAVALASVRIGPRLRLAAAVSVSMLMLLWAGVVTEQRRGPLGELGFARGAHPESAAAWLERAPEGTPVLTGVTASAAVSFWTGGRVRTFVDTRVPLHFGDTDYALARDIFREPAVFERAVRFHGFEAVVVERAAPICGYLEGSDRWSLAVVEEGYSTFVPAAARTSDALGGGVQSRSGPTGSPGSPNSSGRWSEGRALARLAPCGGYYMRENACAAEGAELAKDIQQLRELRPSAFHRYLTAFHAYYCGRNPKAALALLPSERESRAFERDRRYLLARLRLLQGDISKALGLLGDDLEMGDAGALALLTPAIAAGKVPPEQARELLERFASARDDHTDPSVRAQLALLCAEQGDSECVRFHGLRAAAQGSEHVLPALEWLAQHHGSERVRRDARAWRELFAGAPKSAP